MAFLISNDPVLLYPSLLLIFFLVCANTQFHFFDISSFSLLSTHKLQQNGIITDSREESLGRARAAVQEAVRKHKYFSHKNESFIPRGPVYRNPYAFHQSHIEMEKWFKLWVYKEGDPPLFHESFIKGIYSIEGHFIAELERGNSPFLAKHPNEALAFFLPIGITNVRIYVYALHNDYDLARLQRVVADYIGVVSRKYSYWNRTIGADHFLVGCHDWAPYASAGDPKLFKNLVRVLCNANTTEGFQASRDVTLPEIDAGYDRLGPPILGQQPPSQRSILAFFAGGPHGYVRDRLFHYWKDRDSDIQVHQYLPNNLNYFELMAKTKFCLCPSGYEVASPRIVESISSGCVPVLISDGYVPPFSDVLDWTRFSVQISVSRIPEIKAILQGISADEYLEKQKLVMQVQRHFILHRPSQPFDLLDMVLHSIWLRRLNVGLP